MDYWKKTFSTQPDGSLTASEDSLIVSILSAVSEPASITVAGN
jgi:SP family sugar:H+ symporter-like MFS transporter